MSFLSFMALTLIILFVLIITLAGFFLQTFLLHFTTKKFGVENALYKTAIKINIYNVLLIIAASIILMLILNPIGLASLSEILMLVIGFFVLHKLLQKFYNTALKKNIKIYIVYTIFTIILSVLATIFVVIPVRHYAFEPFYTKGAAMEPTFNDNEYIFINKFSYRSNSPERGDIIVLKNPENNQEYFIKRIVGLPGEKIQLLGGEVVIYNDQNSRGEKISEPYLSPDMKTFGLSEEPIELKQGEYYVLGDNRKTSKDSRSFGSVNKNLIVGKYWVTPFKK